MNVKLIKACLEHKKTIIKNLMQFYNYGDQENNLRKQKIYDVTTFIASDTLPPLITDSLTWKRVILFINVNPDLMIIYNMNDNQKWYKLI